MIVDRLRRNAARARAKGSPAVAYTEAQVWARGRGRCYLCKGLLDRDPRAWQIEHVIPIDKGGPDILSNVMPAHRLCNQRKGVKVTTLPDGTLRRAIVATLLVFERLSKLGVRVMPRPPIIGPHVVTLRLATAPGAAHVAPATISEIRAAVNTPTARIYPHGAELRVELPRWPRRPVPLAGLRQTKGLRLSVGLDAENRVVAIDLGASPHVLIAGQTGSGKSVLLQTLVERLALAGARLVLVDADGLTFEPFARLEALDVALARDVDSAHNAVAYVQQAMAERPVEGIQTPLVLMVDEIHTLARDTRELIQDIAQRGRKRRVYVVVATHRPVKDVLTPTLTDQCTWRVAGRVQTAKASELIIGQTGAQFLGKAGDMLLAHGGTVVRFQAALGDASDWAALPGRLIEPAAARPARPVDPRYVRTDDSDRVEWLVERYRSTGAKPSAKAIKDTFGGSTDRARRARDEALQLIGDAA